MSTFPIPPNEELRIKELQLLDVKSTKLGKEFDQLSWLAAKICNAEIALINFIDTDTQWSKSTFGIDLDSMERCDSVCQYTIMDNRFYEVEDLTKDERFKDVWYVQKKPFIKFYGGFPLTTTNGYNIGALCVLDTKPNKLNSDQIKSLQVIATSIVTRIEVQKQNKLLSDSYETNSQLLRVIGHDLRNPTAGIIGIIDLIMELDDISPADLNDMLQMIKKTAQQMQFYTNEILQAGLVHKSILDESSKPVDLVAILKQTIDVYTSFAKTKSIKINSYFDKEVIQISSDASRVMQVLNNLMSNAIKFTNEGGDIYTSISISKNNVTISVRDTGIGMPKDLLNNIFSLDKKYLRKGTAGERSTGIGLNTINSIIRSLDAQLEIESEVGKGTEFKLIFKTT